MNIPELLADLVTHYNALIRASASQLNLTASQAFHLLSIPHDGIPMSKLAHKLGLDNAINDIICIMDSDGSPDVNTIIDFVYGIHTGYDMIIGSRFIPACTIIGQKWIKQYSSRLMNQVIRYLLGTKMNDNTHSYRAISRKAYNKVKDQVHDHHHPEFCLELTVKAQRAGLKVIEAPTDFIERDSGETKMPIASSGMRAIKKIFSLRFSK